MTLVIMAAGMGSRYGGLKQIDPITKHGEFIVDFSIYDAIMAGFDKVVFIIKKENYEIFRETVGKRIEGAIKVEYVFQEMENIPEGFTVPEGRVKPWGTAHAALMAKSVVNEPFAIINSDDFYGRDAYRRVFEFMANQKGEGHYAMAGYILENTITENGHVSRGICDVRDGYLKNVVERTKIQENDGVVQYMEDEKWYDLDRKAVASMNCFAFTPDVFTHLEEGLKVFLADLPNAKDPLKAEYFLPFLVQSKISDGTCDVRVLETTAKWYGVTYAEDKPKFVEFIKSQVAEGVYPDNLWKK